MPVPRRHGCGEDNHHKHAATQGMGCMATFCIPPTRSPSILQVEVGSGDRVLPLASFRGTTRPVLLAGSRAYIQKAQAAAEPYREARAMSIPPMHNVHDASGYASTWLTVELARGNPSPPELCSRQALRERGVSLVPLPSAAAEADDPTERLRALKREFQCVCLACRAPCHCSLLLLSSTLLQHCVLQHNCSPGVLSPTAPAICRTINSLWLEQG
jgi:hypothetical protein